MKRYDYLAISIVFFWLSAVLFLSVCTGRLP